MLSQKWEGSALHDVDVMKYLLEVPLDSLEVSE